MRALFLIVLLLLLAVPAFAQETVACDFGAATAAWARRGYTEIAEFADAETLYAPAEWTAGQTWAATQTTLNYFYRDMNPLYFATFTRESANGRREIVGFIEVRELDEMLWVFMQDLAGREPARNPDVAHYDWHGCAAFVTTADSDAVAWFEGLDYAD